MAIMSLENLKRNMNVGWLLLIVFLVSMMVIFLLTNPQMPLGAAMYGTALVLLLIGLSLEG